MPGGAAVGVRRHPRSPGMAYRVREQLGSDVELTFAHADQAAKALGIDTWDIHWRRLQQKFAEPGRWYHVMAGWESPCGTSRRPSPQTRPALTAPSWSCVSSRLLARL